MGGTIPNPVAIIRGTQSGVRESMQQPTAATVAAPTTSEVSQAGATEMDNKGIKRRRRGRSMTILTGSAGVQEGATLGTPTLLG
jgi:hypothetical protein